MDRYARTHTHARTSMHQARPALQGAAVTSQVPYSTVPIALTFYPLHHACTQTNTPLGLRVNKKCPPPQAHCTVSLLPYPVHVWNIQRNLLSSQPPTSTNSHARTRTRTHGHTQTHTLLTSEAPPTLTRVFSVVHPDPLLH